MKTKHNNLKVFPGLTGNLLLIYASFSSGWSSIAAGFSQLKNSQTAVSMLALATFIFNFSHIKNLIPPEICLLTNFSHVAKANWSFFPLFSQLKVTAIDFSHIKVWKGENKTQQLKRPSRLDRESALITLPSVLGEVSIAVGFSQLKNSNSSICWL